MTSNGYIANNSSNFSNSWSSDTFKSMKDKQNKEENTSVEPRLRTVESAPRIATDFLTAATKPATNGDDVALRAAETVALRAAETASRAADVTAGPAESAADDETESVELRRPPRLSNGYARSVRPISLQDDRLLEKTRHTDRLSYIAESSADLSANSSFSSSNTDAGRPLTVPPRRSKSSLNGRLSGSAQMLNGEVSAPAEFTTLAGMGGGKTALKPPQRSATPGSAGDELNGAPSPSETFRKVEENSNSTSNDIPNNNNAANKSKNHISATNSSMPSVDLSPLDRGLDTSGTNTLRSLDKGISTVPKAAKAQKGRFVKVFPEIAEVDMVIKSYHCALVSDILLQGFLYVTSKWFCFHSKLMGKKRIAIPVSMVTGISKKKTAIIIPNAISIVTAKDKYLFGSLMSRDNTFDLMHEVWKQNQQSSQDLEDGDQNGDQVAEEEVSLSKSMMSTHTNSSEETLGSSSSDSYVSFQAGGPLPDRSLGDREDPHSKPPACNGACSCHNHSSSTRPSIQHYSKNVSSSPSNLGSMVKSPLTMWSEVIAWMKGCSRNSLVLCISAILVILLLFSALVLAYKLFQLQSNIRSFTSGGWPPNPSRLHPSSPNIPSPSSRPLGSSGESFKSNTGSSQGMEGDEELLFRRQDYHFTAIERINSVLESHIHMLDQINEAMRSLKQIAATTCLQSTNSNAASLSDHESLTNQQRQEL